MTQQLHVAGLPRVTEDGYFDAANANKSWVRVYGGQSSEFPIYHITRGKNTLYLFNMTQQLHVAGLPRVTEDGYFDAANANKSWVRVYGGQSSEFPIYHITRERTIINETAVTYTPSCRSLLAALLLEAPL